MTRDEAERLSTDLEGMKASEALVEYIDEVAEDDSPADQLENVLRTVGNDGDMPIGLTDTIEAIALEALDKIRAAAIEAAKSAAAKAGITDYELPAAKPELQDAA